MCKKDISEVLKWNTSYWQHLASSTIVFSHDCFSLEYIYIHMYKSNYNDDFWTSFTMWTRDRDLNCSTYQKWADVPPFTCRLNEDRGMKMWKQLWHQETSYRAWSFQRLIFWYIENQLRALQILLILMIHNISGRGIKTMSSLNAIMNTKIPWEAVFSLALKRIFETQSQDI